MGATTLRVGGLARTIPGIAFPDLRRPPEHGDGWVRFVQTTGGRTGSPMPRKVNRPPYVQITSPTVWTTLALTLYADGRVEFAGDVLFFRPKFAARARGSVFLEIVNRGRDQSLAIMSAAAAPTTTTR